MMLQRLRNWLFPSKGVRRFNAGSLPVRADLGKPIDVEFDQAIVAPAPAPREPAGNLPLTRPIGRRSRDVIRSVFDPSHPVDGRLGLSGRTAELDKLVDAVLYEQKHGIIFGPRGSGKTSLVRAFGDFADEDGATVLYNSMGGNLSFVDLFRPYLRELVSASPHLARTSSIRNLLEAPFDASLLASSLAETITRETIFLIDEFDRIEQPEIKEEVAGFMKLLSDMRSKVRLVIVGIAVNLNDLLEGHPSLRRHLASVSIAGLAGEEQYRLLQNCCDRSGLSIDPDAADAILVAAMGSPYHLRLFGLNAALQTDRRGETHITRAIVDPALSSALSQWADVNADGYRLARSYIASRLPSLSAAIVACCASATKGRFDAELVTGMLVGEGIVPTQEEAEARYALMLSDLATLIRKSATEESYLFRDTLIPQFFILMAQGVEPSSPHAVAEELTVSRILAGGIFAKGASE